MKSDASLFRDIESEYSLFSIKFDQMPVWERIRFDAFRTIAQQTGRGQAHTANNSGFSTNIKGFRLLLKNAVYRNPYLANEHDFLFVGHQRRKLEEDGYWWDLYCDPIHNRDELDYVHMESPYLMSHRQPAKTENLRYLELIEYTGKLQQKLGFRSPSLPDDVVAQLCKAESEIYDQLNVKVDLVAKAKEAIHARNTTLPLYERLLERIDPEVVVLIVSYGKETLIEACKRKGIPVVELQHGVIYDYHFGYSYPDGETKKTFPDYLFTFGEFWNQNARFPISDDYIIPVGYPYLESRLDTYDDVDQSKQILFISQGTIGHELSKFALSVHKDERIDHKVVYKLHPGEQDRWREEYPWLTKSDIRVIEGSEPPLYWLFAESTAQIGVGSTAVYEGLCFDLETFVFQIEGEDTLKPLINDGAASLITDVDDLSNLLGSFDVGQFDRNRYFKQNSVDNVIRELKRIQNGE